MTKYNINQYVYTCMYVKRYGDALPQTGPRWPHTLFVTFVTMHEDEEAYCIVRYDTVLYDTLLRSTRIRVVRHASDGAIDDLSLGHHLVASRWGLEIIITYTSFRIRHI